MDPSSGTPTPKQRLNAWNEDYRSRDQGCVIKMLEKLKLPSLQDHRKQLNLTFFYKIVEGLVPAMPPHQFLEPERANKRPIRATTKFKDFITSNVVEKHQTLNSRPYKTISTRTDQFKNSFFPRTVIDWNQLPDDAVQATSTEAFKRRIPLCSEI